MDVFNTGRRIITLHSNLIALVRTIYIYIYTYCYCYAQLICFRIQLTDLAKLLGAQWKELGDAEKKPYNVAYATDKKVFDGVKAKYDKKKAKEDAAAATAAAAAEDDEEESNDQVSDSDNE